VTRAAAAGCIQFFRGVTNINIVYNSISIKKLLSFIERHLINDNIINNNDRYSYSIIPGVPARLCDYHYHMYVRIFF